MRQVALLALGLLATCTGSTSAELSQNEKIRLDAAELCSLVEDHYVYFEERAAHWPDACTLAEEEALAATDGPERLAVLERLLDELYDPHASLGTNTASSPRLVPSGADYWLNMDGDAAIVVGVRSGSGAEKAGIHVGDVITALMGEPLLDAARLRIRTVRELSTSQRLEWAVNAMAAGYRGTVRSVTLMRDGEQIKYELGDPVPEWAGEYVTARILDDNIGYVRLNNSLGDDGTVEAFDAALETLKDARGWILDLRDTPGGGNTSIAEPIMGRFITEDMPYQRIIPSDEPAYDRTVSPRGPWTVDSPLLVLVGHWTGSMGEGMAIGFDGMGRGHVMGSEMAGLAGGTESFTLTQTGIPVSFPTYDLAHVDDTSRHEWAPPHSVLADNGSGPDLALDEAVLWHSGPPE